jgi:hypothetical protein
MKMTEEKESALAAQQPVFHKVAENLYRLESSGGYYALVKRAASNFVVRSRPKIEDWRTAS